MFITGLLANKQLKVSGRSEKPVFVFATTGPEFWDKEREYRQCWVNSSRDWSRYMQTEQFTYSWDFRQIESRTKTT
jgi:hypothetical protein